jgi:hypothetical protein
VMQDVQPDEAFEQLLVLRDRVLHSRSNARSFADEIENGGRGSIYSISGAESDALSANDIASRLRGGAENLMRCKREPHGGHRRKLTYQTYSLPVVRYVEDIAGECSA